MQKRPCVHVMSAREASVKRAGQRLALSLSLPSLLLIFDLQEIASLTQSSDDSSDSSLLSQ